MMAIVAAVGALLLLLVAALWLRGRKVVHVTAPSSPRLRISPAMMATRAKSKPVLAEKKMSKVNFSALSEANQPAGSTPRGSLGMTPRGSTLGGGKLTPRSSNAFAEASMSRKSRKHVRDDPKEAMISLAL